MYYWIDEPELPLHIKSQRMTLIVFFIGGRMVLHLIFSCHVQIGLWGCHMFGFLYRLRTPLSALALTTPQSHSLALCSWQSGDCGLCGTRKTGPCSCDWEKSLFYQANKCNLYLVGASQVSRGWYQVHSWVARGDISPFSVCAVCFLNLYSIECYASWSHFSWVDCYLSACWWVGNCAGWGCVPLHWCLIEAFILDQALSSR